MRLLALCVMLYRTVALAGLLGSCSGLVVPLAPACSNDAVARLAGAGAARSVQWARSAAVCMQAGDAAEAAPAAAAAEGTDAVSDFTEDLLEALTTEDEPLMEEEPAVFAKGAEGVELESLPSFDNAGSVEAMRSRCACA